MQNNGEETQPRNGDGRWDAGFPQERLDELLRRIEPYWPDLLRQGSIQRRYDTSPTETYVLKFRQQRSGNRGGSQKTLYIGKDRRVAQALLNEIWCRREKAHTRFRPKLRPAMTDEEAAHALTETIRRFPSLAYSPVFALRRAMVAKESRETQEADG